MFLHKSFIQNFTRETNKQKTNKTKSNQKNKSQKQIKKRRVKLKVYLTLHCENGVLAWHISWKRRVANNRKQRILRCVP